MTKKIILTIWAFLFFSVAAYAQGLTADGIVGKANLAAYYAGTDGLADVKMTITDAQRRERVREFRILRFNKQKGGDQKFYVYFHKPADVAKMVYMVWKYSDRDDDRWLYLPALDLIKRVAAGDKRSSFAGSHFVYEDVSGRNTDADTHELAETTDRQYKLKNVPKAAKGTEFAYYDVWINKDNFMPVKAEYYDAKGRLIRTIEALEVKDIEGHPTVTRSLARDLVRGGETTMEFSSVDYDAGLTEDIFAERYLRQAPAQWIK